MEATTNPVTSSKVKSTTKKKVAKHERCAICKYPFGTGTCESCRDPKCSACGLRLLTAEVEVGTQCGQCSPDARMSVDRAAKGGRLVAIALTD